MTENTIDQTYRARETWFARAIDFLRPKFAEITEQGLPEKIRVSVGYGPTGARTENGKILGITLHKFATADQVIEVWISPEHASTTVMLGTLLHELIHVYLNEFHTLEQNSDGEFIWHRHDGQFAELGTRLGLTGRMSHSEIGEELAWELMSMEGSLIAELGEYPGSAVDLENAVNMIREMMPVPAGDVEETTITISPAPPLSSGGKTQTTRMIKLICPVPECPCSVPAKGKTSARPYSVRTSMTMIEIGFPSCPAGHKMSV
jgi:hypothetical protein